MGAARSIGVSGASYTFPEVSQEVTMSWVQPRVLDLAQVSGASYTFPEVSQEVTMSWVQPRVLDLAQVSGASYSLK